jgi:diguanylate cyclase (GGDEF)-like protein
MLARGCSVKEASNYICAYAERLAPGVLCSIVTVDRDNVLHPLAGESLSTAYSQALDGIRIGPGVGSCGTAAYFRRAVAVQDIFTDPLWAPYQELAATLDREHAVKACWSSPILQSDGRVLGAFGFYYTETRGPTIEERAIVAECVHLCSLILEREEIRADNQRLAYFDVLTGLGNRTNFLKTLDIAFRESAEDLGILLIDIDRLGRINNVLGNAIGDNVIRAVADLVSEFVEPGTLYRVDADEFAVLIKGGVRSISEIASDILQAMERRAPLQDGLSFPVSVSCGGVVSAPSDRTDVQTFIQHANVALHHAKQTARGSFVPYSDDLARTIGQRFQVLQTVTNALAEGRIEAHYQPIVRLETGEIVGLEALCRIRTAESGIISAGMFAEALQDLSLGHLLTDRMMEQVARDIRYWLDLGVPPHYVSLNVSMADFDQGNLRERMRAVFSRHRVALSHVVLEVTETVYMDKGDRKVMQTIEELRADGLLVALDDFGTGHASLTHLLNFPVDIIKIDKSFVDQIPGGVGEVIVKALLDIAAGLGVRIVAEGVETAEQVQRLKHLKCSLVQGYFFGRPVDRDATTKALQVHPVQRSATS